MGQPRPCLDAGYWNVFYDNPDRMKLLYYSCPVAPGPNGNGWLGLGDETWWWARMYGTCRYDLLKSSALIYALAAILSYWRLLAMLGVSESVGVLKIIMVQMIKRDVISWFMLTSLITVGFSVAFQILEPANILNPKSARRPFWLAWWGLLGDADVDERYEHVSYTDDESVITPLLLFVYLILATVVLVNLLIAQMSKTYEMIIDESRLIWQFDYVHSIVIEYKDNRDVLPAPLNIIDMLIIDPIKLLRYCCRGCGPARNQSTQGFRLAPNAATTTELRAAAQRAARHFVKHHEAEKLSSTEHRVETSSAASSSSRSTSATCSSSSPAASTS